MESPDPGTTNTTHQIFDGMKYMLVTLSFIYARMVFIQLEKRNFDLAENYIMNFENRKWWERQSCRTYFLRIK